MTPNTLRLPIAALLIAAASLTAAPLTENTPVYASPDDAGAPISSLAAGTDPVAAQGVNAPSGWLAVSLAGPHEVYAANRDVTKSLDVRTGASYRTEARDNAPVLATAGKDDPAEIIDYRGRWTKFRLNKDITGYIRTAGAATAAPATSASAPAPAAPAAAAPAPAITAIGRAAPVGDGGSSALPRLFQGKFASTYSPLRPRRPYDFQLNDDAGSRYAYVDVSKLLATEQLDKYIDRTVVIYGTARAVPNSRDMVVVAESLQLR